MRGRSRQSRHTAHLMSSGSSGADDASAVALLVAVFSAVALLVMAMFAAVLLAARDGEDSGDNRVGMMIVTFYLAEWFLMGLSKKECAMRVIHAYRDVKSSTTGNKALPDGPFK